jgi:hypothetical protein
MEAEGLEDDLKATGLEETSDGEGQDSKEEEDEEEDEEEGHEEGEEGHEDGVGLDD